jgi:serine/threonine-protein kinase HipA
MAGPHEPRDIASGEVPALAVARAAGMRTADLAEFWRRLVYSILIGNVDDHMRNHGFLMQTAGEWSLAPAYDVNPTPLIDRAHERQTPVSEDSPRPADAVAELEDAIAHAARFRLRPGTARAILAEVRAAVAGWRGIAARLGLGPAAIAAYADVYEPG